MGNFRTIDGSANNSDQGAANSQLIRRFPNAFDFGNGTAFEDGISTPRGGEFDNSDLPNPRTISNLVVDQVEDVTNFLNASDWLWQWGQLIDHDFALNESSAENPPAIDGSDSTPISVPQNDLNDPFVAQGITELPFIRVPAVEGTGTGTDNPRQIDNQLTAFIDASTVYGSDDERAEFLRDNESGKGLLVTSEGDNGEVLLPLNDGTQANATGGGALGDVQFVAGDIRANEQIGLIAVHNLLVREHNRIALELHERLEAGDDDELLDKFDEFVLENSDLSPEEAKDEFLYQSARKVVGAEVQVITYEEFLPLLIGDTLEDYEGFDADVNPQVSVEFADAAYRLGHTLLSNQLRRVEDNGITETALADAFFTPEDVQEQGIDSLLTGLIYQGAQEVDNQIVDAVRDFLFPAGTGGLDLAAVNIARGREVGIASYTEIYEQIFGVEITSFDQLGSDGLGLFSDSVVSLFEAAYESVGQIDLWLGGISELPDEHGGLLGPTLSFFIADQFARSRDGDEFFYLNELEHLEILAPDIQDTTLADLIRNNVADPYLVPDNAFEVPFENEIPGDETDNILNGAGLDDLIDGQAGNDEISGDQGDDLLLGGQSNDLLLGNQGDDIVLGGQGNDIIYGGQNDDNLNGGDDDDLLVGNQSSDTINGDAGDDLLVGNQSSDIINGGAGDDIIYGGQGDDQIRGGAGDDLLFGNMAGDTFILAVGEGTDTIIDFGNGPDVIGLADGLAFADLTLSGNDISITATGEILATLTGVDTTTLSSGNFVSV